MAAAGAGKMWGHAYSVTPSGIFAAPDTGYRRPEDLAGVPVASSAAEPAYSGGAVEREGAVVPHLRPPGSL